VTKNLKFSWTPKNLNLAFATILARGCADFVALQSNGSAEFQRISSSRLISWWLNG
jgi:hypothetical protein